MFSECVNQNKPSHFYKSMQTNSNKPEEINLQKFAYTPKGRTQSSMAPPASVNPSLKIPDTPSGRGWEHLDLYHQQRYQQLQEGDYEEGKRMNILVF